MTAATATTTAEGKKKNFARVSRVFVHFFAVVARLQRETSYFLVCGGREHNITVFFSFSELRYRAPLEFSSRKIRHYLPN